MKHICFFFLFLLFPSFIFCQKPVKSGIELLRDTNFFPLYGKKIGLITNHTAVDSDFKQTVDILFEAEEVELVALFAAEEGIRGTFDIPPFADSVTDAKTGLPVYPLTGSTRKPTPEMMRKIDVLLFDIQDIGIRTSKYVGILGLAMEAAAENKLEFMVLDRPNPLGGVKIEGNIIDDKNISAIGQYKIPYIHGLTSGELARLLNYSGMLSKRKKCRLQIVAMQGWKRNMLFSETGLPWIPVDYNLPFGNSPVFFSMTEFFRLFYPDFFGFDTHFPAQILVAEWMDEKMISTKLNALNIPGVRFQTFYFQKKNKKQKIEKGIQIHITDYAKLENSMLQFQILHVLHETYPNKNFFSMAPTRKQIFNRMTGTYEIFKSFSEENNIEKILSIWTKDCETFRKMAQKYYLYD